MIKINKRFLRTRKKNFDMFVPLIRCNKEVKEQLLSTIVVVIKSNSLCMSIERNNIQQKKSNGEKENVNEKPANDFPETPTTCCMSGCANCVWIEYAEKLNNYFKDGGEKAIKEIDEKIDDPNLKAFLLQEIRMRTKNS